MRLLALCAVLVIQLFSVSCDKQGETNTGKNPEPTPPPAKINDSAPPAPAGKDTAPNVLTSTSTSPSLPPTTASDPNSSSGAVSNPLGRLAFDAFLIWRDGKGINGGNGIYEYPIDYKIEQNRIVDNVFVVDPPDGVFYVLLNDDLKKTTNGALVSGEVTSSNVRGGILTYPENEGRRLVIKFNQQSSVDMTHAEAVKYCSDIGLRLPTIRELFDFCAAGLPANQNRCSSKGLWSSSVSSDQRIYALEFGGQFDYVMENFRFMKYSVRCVGN